MSDKSASPTFESQYAELEAIAKRIDNPTTPIDELGQNVKRGAALIAALNAKLNEAEADVRDAFKATEAAAPKAG